MFGKRSSKDRRAYLDRRKGDISSFSGTENRGVTQQRRNKDRRETNNNLFVERALSLGKEGRRFENDQRQFSYAGYIPERRLCNDRRSLFDRRTKWNIGCNSNFSNNISRVNYGPAYVCNSSNIALILDRSKNLSYFWYHKFGPTGNILRDCRKTLNLWIWCL